MDDDDIEKYIQHIIDIKETSLNLSNRSLRAVPLSVSLCSFLQNLYLNNNELIIPPTEQLSSMINLETLSLEYNQLTILPDTLWNLTSLIRLNLSHNPLGQIPLELGQLKNLHELCIEDNELNDLPDCLQDCLKLSYLNLNGNHFVHVPSVIGKISSLNIVCLQRNAIAEIDDDTLLMFSNMTKVDLRENPLVDKPKHWKGLEFIKVGRCIDVTSFDEENDENNSESLGSSHDDNLE
ncbi:unnamed protein product [Rotaria sp. Silwood2]|nr:unnamed protein product [Rotaria sp. Silwood2]